ALPRPACPTPTFSSALPAKCASAISCCGKSLTPSSTSPIPTGRISIAPSCCAPFSISSAATGVSAASLSRTLPRFRTACPTGLARMPTRSPLHSPSRRNEARPHGTHPGARRHLLGYLRALSDFPGGGCAVRDFLLSRICAHYECLGHAGLCRRPADSDRAAQSGCAHSISHRAGGALPDDVRRGFRQRRGAGVGAGDGRGVYLRILEDRDSAA